MTPRPATETPRGGPRGKPLARRPAVAGAVLSAPGCASGDDHRLARLGAVGRAVALLAVADDLVAAASGFCRRRRTRQGSSGRRHTPPQLTLLSPQVTGAKSMPGPDAASSPA